MDGEYNSVEEAKRAEIDKKIRQLAMIFGIPAIIDSAARVARQNGVRIRFNSDFSDILVEEISDREM